MNSLNKKKLYSSKDVSELEQDLILYFKKSDNVILSINNVFSNNDEVKKELYDLYLPRVIESITKKIDDELFDKFFINDFIQEDLKIEKENRQFLEVTYAHTIIANHLLKKMTIDELQKQAKDNSSYIGWLFHNATISVLLATDFVKVVIEENKNNEEILKFFCNNFHKLQVLKDNNINIWNVIDKGKDIETLYPSFVWHKERVLSNVKGFKTTINRKIVFFDQSQDIWKNISTEKTNNIDLYSRLLITMANASKEDFIYKFLKKHKLNNLNLYTQDFPLTVYNKTIYQPYVFKFQLVNILMRKKYLKTLNYLYGHNNIEVGNIITIKPSVKLKLVDIKMFLKVIHKNNIFEFETGEEILKSYIEKKSFYTNSCKDLQNIYFPIDPVKLEKNKNNKFVNWVDFKQIMNYEGYEDNDKKIKSLQNLFNYLNKTINWEQEQTIKINGKNQTYKNKLWFLLIKASMPSINKEEMEKESLIFIKDSSDVKIKKLEILKNFLFEKVDFFAGHYLFANFLIMSEQNQLKINSDFFDDKLEKINKKIILGWNTDWNDKLKVKKYEAIILKYNMDSILEIKEKELVKKEKLKI